MTRNTLTRRGAALMCALGLPVAPAAGATPLTPAGWGVDPAGTEVGVSQATAGMQGPLGAALSPDGRQLLAASSGAARIESADLFDLDRRQRTSYVGYDALAGASVFYGVAWARDGHTAYVSGGGQNVVHVLQAHDGQLTESGAIAAPGFPAGLAYGRTSKGDRLYVANNLSASASAAGGNPPGHTVTVIGPQSGAVTGTVDLGAALEPLDVALDRTGAKTYVTNWMGRSVSVIDTAAETKTADIVLSPPQNPALADHPSAVTANPVRDQLYTANANSDTVSVIDTAHDRLAATIGVGLVSGGPKGAIPDGLDISPDGRTMYVALAGENAVAVVDLDSRRAVGFIPTGWYPSDVSVTPDGRRLAITNTNASGAGPNPCGGLTRQTPCPTDPQIDPPNRIDRQYTGSMIKGSVQIVDVPRDAGALRSTTEQVRRNNQVRPRRRIEPLGARRLRHVIYVVKENRTYDQVFGDLPKGNGDPSLNIFGDDSAPNHRALAQRFALFDNFYADAEVSPDGHNWITQAAASDYVDKTWPVGYSPSRRGAYRVYDWEDVPFSQQFPTEPLLGDPSVPRSASAQTRGYLWDNAFFHGVSFRDYGEYTQTDCAGSGNVSHTTHLDDTRFGDHVDERYPGYSTSCSDHTEREPEWEREFRGFESTADLPALSIVRLPNDHTSGTRAGAVTPQGYMADNDLALGRMVDVVSHSRYWKDTAILVTEDDAQNGPDHVDAHRTLALLISPYTQAGRVDSTHYDTASMVATVEDLLGLGPMSITDARASRMWGAFTRRADLAPYQAIRPKVVPFGEPDAPVNPATAPMAREAATWNLRTPTPLPRWRSTSRSG
ncbi:MAG: bifunctional YncE family protein/alkaline phosphatase family protein, partial [Actinomycetota bacterium]|nr:bifunctional YncE family protein/alkaline phosphatase family protein [Actinomycetota bacterium]